MSEQARVYARVSGRVQAVGFRYFVLRKAQELNLKGWVRNRRGGQVELVAEGPKADLHRLLEAVREGPAMSWVESVETDWMAAQGGVGGFGLKHTV